MHNIDPTGPTENTPLVTGGLLSDRPMTTANDTGPNNCHNWRLWRAIAGSLLVGTILVITAFLFFRFRTSVRSNLDSQLVNIESNASDNITFNYATLTVNGALVVQNGLLLNPTPTPQNPILGQIYLNQADNLLYYYNGNNFIGLGAGTTDIIQESETDVAVARLNSAGNGQIFTGTNQYFRNSINSTTGFQIQNASGTALFSVDTANGEVELGQVNSLSGKLIFNNVNSANKLTLQPAAAITGDRAVSLPDESGTVCLQNSLSCGFASASTAFVQGGNTFGTAGTIGTQDNQNLNIVTNNTTRLTVTSSGNIAVGGLTSCNNVYTTSANYLNCGSALETSIGKIRVFGHSYAQGVGANDGGGWDARLASMLHSYMVNKSNSGAILAWHEGTGVDVGGYARVLQNTTRTRTTAPYVTNDGVGMYNFGINDIGILVTPAVGQIPFKEALRTVISRDRAAGVFEDTDASVSYGGSWSQVNNTSVGSGAGYTETTSNGSTVTITVPASFPGGTIGFGVTAGTGSSGGVFSFTVDGSGAGSIDTRSIAQSTRKTGIVKRFTGLSSGAHTIVATISSVSGSAIFDYWQIESTQSPLTVIHNVPRLPNYDIYALFGVTITDADIATMNSNINSVAAEFDSAVVVVDTDAVLNKEYANFAADVVHPNDLGHAKIAAETLKKIREAQTSLNQFTYASGGTSSVIFKSYTNNSEALNVVNASSSSVLIVNTTSNRVGIGTSSPQATFHVSASGATDELFRITDTTSSINVLTIANQGVASFRPDTNSTSTFKLQDASGNNVLNLNTSNLRVELAQGMDIRFDGVGNTRNALTKIFNCSSSEAVKEIVIVDTANDGAVIRTTTAGSNRVAGVVVAKPSSTQCTVAIMGVVEVNTTGTISRGDLLETSTTVGTAQTSAAPAVGAILGVALSDGAGGDAWILIRGN